VQRDIDLNLDLSRSRVYSEDRIVFRRKRFGFGRMATLTGSSVPSPHDSASDEELLFYMSMQAEEPALAQEAWNVFYGRHVGYLFGVCRKSYSSLGQAVVEEVVQQTFVKAYEGADTYDGAGLSGDEARRNVRGWLGKIARNVFVDTIRKQPLLLPLPEAGDSAAELDIIGRGAKWWDCGEPVESPRVRLLQEALETLSERELDILRITAMWFQPGQTQQRIPTADLQRLAASLQTTAVNMRQIRKRAIAKLKEYIESREKQE
jgi:RNA polymerase sigma factor (sigma-70 family)